MKASIWDREALVAVSPAALSAYARVEGWDKVETYGEHSDVYAAAGLPEIILPRTQRLGDYANVVSQLIGIFAQVAGMDEPSLYRDLVTADRDVIRVRAGGEDDGAVALSDGVRLVSGAHDMLLSAACSLSNPRPLYRAGAIRSANDYMRRVCLGQTEQGSFTISLLTPVIPPPTQLPLIPGCGDSDPIERRITVRLSDALNATREATEKTVAGGNGAFSDAVFRGTSANLCEALVQLIEPFPTLDVSLSWARTRPRERARDVILFSSGDAPILREAAREFRNREPRPDVRLFGFVHRLRRGESQTDGTVALRSDIDGEARSVSAVLNSADYGRAVEAHRDNAAVIATGDLQRVDQRWSLLNPRIVSVISSADPSGQTA